MMWELAESIILLRALREVTGSYYGWYPALGGGVLIKGYSDHDLDVVFTPHYGAILENLHAALRKFGWKLVRDAETVRNHWKEPDQKHVEEWATATGRRVDVIVMLPINYERKHG